MILEGPGLHLVEQPGRRLGQQGHDLLQAGPLHLAGLAGAASGMGRAVQAGQDLEVGFVLAGSVALGVTAAGLGAVAERVLGVVMASSRGRPLGARRPFYHAR